VVRGKRFPNLLLAGSLEETVSILGGGLEFGVLASLNERRLIEAANRVIGIHVQSGDKGVAPYGALEGGSRATDIVRTIPRRVDHSIPVLPGEKRDISSAVSYDGFYAEWKIVKMAAAVEDGDAVSAPRCLEHDMSTDKDSSAENQHPHAQSLADGSMLVKYGSEGHES
jgi:hypothetical protein